MAAERAVKGDHPVTGGRRVLLAGLVGIAAVAMVAQLRPEAAGAHATLIGAEPAQNVFLQRPPTRVVLTFSEPLEPRASTIRLLDSNGKPIDIEAPVFTAAANNVMRVLLPRLAPGIYNVVWTNVSTVDGHPIRGSYPFTVLNADGSVPDAENRFQGAGRGSGTDPAPLADAVAVRGLTLLAVLLLAGAPAALWLAPSESWSAGAGRGMAILGLVVGVAAAGLWLEFIRSSYAEAGLGEALTGTRTGTAWWMRLGALVLVLHGTLLSFLRPRWAGAPLGLALVSILGTLVFTSHAATGAGRAWAGAIDFLHLASGFAWLGAVVAVLVAAALARGGERWGLVLGRLATVASVMVFVVLATGILNSVVELDSPSRLKETRYGGTLLLKLFLIVPLLGVAAYNATRGRRGLLEGTAGGRRRFLLTGGAEVLLGAAVIGVAAVLSQTTAAKLVVDPPDTRPFAGTSQNAGVAVALTIDPNRTGLNTFRAKVTSAGSGEPLGATRVRLTFRYLDDQSVGPSTLGLVENEKGEWVGQGPYLPLEGQWRVEAEVRPATGDDAVAFFEVRPAGSYLGAGGGGGRFANPAPGLTWNEFGGLVVVLAGLGLAIWRLRLAAFGRLARWAANGGTVGTLGLAMVLLFGVHGHQPTSALPSNPIFPDQNSIETGRRLYEQNCRTCHGVRGVPPEGLDLEPYPLDLTVHVPQHPDGQIFRFIERGLPGTSMKAWGDGRLSDDEIWHLVNYLRTLRLELE